MGTPEFAVEGLRCLVEGGYNIVGVITMPDKPAGRGHKIQYSPVKQYALDHDLPLLQPEKLKDEAFVQALRDWKADLQIVVAFRMFEGKNGTVILVPFDINGAERTARAEVLAGAAADAAGLVHDRNARGVGIPGLLMHHLDSPGGAVAGTVAALHAVGIDDAVGGDPDGMADLHRRLVLLGDRAYGPRGTDLRTLRTFGAAVTPFVGHLGYHQRHQLTRRPQHLVGTHGHAQLASGAVRLHITHGERSGRGNGRRTPGNFPRQSMQATQRL